MKLMDQVSNKFKFITLFMAILFLWGAIGQLLVHVCCDHCHEGFFCEETIAYVETSEPSCCSCASTGHQETTYQHNPAPHHCDCSDKHLPDSEESKIESSLPQISNHELLLFVCQLSRIIPAFIADETIDTPYYSHIKPTTIDGRGVLLQSQILII